MPVRRVGVDQSDIAPMLTDARRHNWLVDDPALLRPTDEGRCLLNNLVGLFLP